MIPVNGRVYPRPSHVLLEFQPTHALSNVFNCYVEGDRLERTVSRCDANAIVGQADALMKETLRPVSDWDISQVVTTDKVAGANGIAGLVDKLSILGALLSDVPQHYRSFGQHMRDYAKRTRISHDIGVASSGLPFGYDWVHLIQGMVTLPNAFCIPNPNHPASMLFARLVAEWDRGVYSINLLSNADRVGNFDIKDRVTGQHVVTVQRARAPHAHRIALAMLLPTLYMDLVWPVMTLAHQLLATRSPYWAERLHRHEEWGKRLARLPRNQITSLVASLAGHVKVNSNSGEKPVYLDVTGHAIQAKRLSDIAIEIQAAAASSAHLSWGEWDPSMYMHPYTLIAQYESLGQPMLDEIERVKTTLHWSSLSSGDHMINQRGGDFVWCDGEGYSENPYTGLLGLKPVVAPNNALALIDDRRTEKDWNSAERPVGTKRSAGTADESTHFRLTFSAMVVKGRHTDVGDGSESPLYFLPGNAYLGEEGAQPVRLGHEMEDVRALVALRYFTEQSDNYISEYYLEPTTTSDPEVYRTSWDTWSITPASDKRTAFNKLIGSMPREYIRPVTDAIFYRFPEGRLFYTRFVVRSARAPEVHHFTPDGLQSLPEKLDGHVQFTSGEVSLNSSAEPLQQIVVYGFNPAHHALLSEVTGVGG